MHAEDLMPLLCPPTSPMLPHLFSQQDIHNRLSELQLTPSKPKTQDKATDFPPYLTENIFDICSTQLMPPRINIIQDLMVFCCNAIVSLPVTAAKVFIGRAELQVKRRLERWPIIQTLRMPQDTAYTAEQGETKTDTWARKGSSRATASPSSAWPNIHFLQCRLPEVRCMEILDLWFIHSLRFINCQPQSSTLTRSGLLTFPLPFSLKFTIWLERNLPACPFGISHVTWLNTPPWIFLTSLGALTNLIPTA